MRRSRHALRNSRAAIKSELPPTATAGAEGLRGNEAVTPEPSGTEGLRGKPPVLPLEGAKATRSDSEEVLDTWTPPPGATVHERAEPGKEERMFSGAAPEPFVNETMAQLYLQQGYRQLALRVYRQLAEVRPNDQALKDRIAQIEAEDRAAHPEEAAQARREPPPIQAAEARREPPPIEAPQARREAPPIERPSAPPASPRSPSIEAPTPGGPAESEEAPSFDRSPVDSPPTRPSRERESIEAPTRDEPRAEPEGIAARQPSVKEFFATLGRRRPPRVGGGASGGGGGGVARSVNSVPSDMGASLTVNPADSRAASRLAGAFSGAVGTSRTPPTPPMPTPRVNPRLPHTQESEEDVAKFRAWLDGLTGE